MLTDEEAEESVLILSGSAVSGGRQPYVFTGVWEWISLLIPFRPALFRETVVSPLYTHLIMMIRPVTCLSRSRLKFRTAMIGHLNIYIARKKNVHVIVIV